MINLLDRETRTNLRAARRNVLLRRALGMLLIIGVLMTACYAVGYFILDNQAAAYRQEAAHYVPEKQKYTDTIKQAGTFNANLATAKKIMQSEFFFSNLLIIFSETLPKNTVLDSMNTTTSNLSQSVTFSIRTKSNVDADKAKLAMQNTPYFKDTKIRVITKDDQGVYPYIAQIITIVDIKAINDAQRAGKL